MALKSVKALLYPNPKHVVQFMQQPYSGATQLDKSYYTEGANRSWNFAMVEEEIADLVDEPVSPHASQTYQTSLQQMEHNGAGPGDIERVSRLVKN